MASYATACHLCYAFYIHTLKRWPETGHVRRRLHYYRLWLYNKFTPPHDSVGVGGVNWIFADSRLSPAENLKFDHLQCSVLVQSTPPTRRRRGSFSSGERFQLGIGADRQWPLRNEKRIWHSDAEKLDIFFYFCCQGSPVVCQMLTDFGNSLTTPTTMSGLPPMVVNFDLWPGRWSTTKKKPSGANVKLWKFYK